MGLCFSGSDKNALPASGMLSLSPIKRTSTDSIFLSATVDTPSQARPMTDLSHTLRLLQNEVTRLVMAGSEHQLAGSRRIEVLVKQVLGRKRINFTFDEQNRIITVVFHHTDKTIGDIVVSVLFHEPDVHVIAASRHCIPLNYSTQLLEFLARANYNMQIGHFDVDLSDGDVRFNVVVRVDEAWSDQEISTMFEQSFDLVPSVYARYSKGIAALMTGKVHTGREAVEVVEGNLTREMSSSEVTSSISSRRNSVSEMEVRRLPRLVDIMVRTMEEAGIANYDTSPDNQRPLSVCCWLGTKGNKWTLTLQDVVDERILRCCSCLEGLEFRNTKEVYEFIAMANANLAIGHFDVSVEQATVKFTISQSYHSLDPSSWRPIIRLLFKVAYDLFSAYLPAIILVSSGQASPKHAFATIDSVTDGEIHIDIDDPTPEAPQIIEQIASTRAGETGYVLQLLGHFGALSPSQPISPATSSACSSKPPSPRPLEEEDVTGSTKR